MTPETHHGQVKKTMVLLPHITMIRSTKNQCGYIRGSLHPTLRTRCAQRCTEHPIFQGAQAKNALQKSWSQF